MSLSWEDKEVRFDISFNEMRFIPGEKYVDRLENIEDRKGNSGDRGRLIVTTLRILWHSLTSPRINISIGYDCIININTKVINSKVRGMSQALHILTFSSNTRFEFIFVDLVLGNKKNFNSLMGVHKAYVSSKLYRELKLRSAILQNKQLNLLPLEHIFSKVGGIWNLSSDQGNLGHLILTNIRVVWFADMNEEFNMSLPHLQIKSIKIRDTKFGNALVITSTEESGGFILGFRIDPEEKLQTIFKELKSLTTVYFNNPIYGVEYKWISSREEKIEENFPGIMETEEIEEPKSEVSNALITYLADSQERDRPPVFSTELGLSIEGIKEGYSLHKLWEVIPQP